MTILYCDCFSGISGDMFLGALLDAGLPVEHLARQYSLLGLPEFQEVSAEKVTKGAIAATLLKLDIIEEHAHHEGHSHHEAHSHHRHLGDIKALIMSSGLSEKVKTTTLAIFQKLAEAEAKVHGSSIEEVHFHEVGAVDSILDIVGAAVGLEYFGVTNLCSSSLPLGSGQVMTEHGLLPLPAPATMELMRMAGAPMRPSPATVELVTPTGAAILAALADFSQPDMNITQVGVGAGQRDLEWPNILRIMIGEPKEEPGGYVEIETNIDDMNPQIFGYVMEKLFLAGALDVFFTPVFMKKNRPATRLSVIARSSSEEDLCGLLLRETSTLGVRVKSIRRREAGREIRKVETRYGAIAVKLKILDGKVCHAAPEFDDCARAAKERGAPLADVMQEATAACRVWLVEKADLQ